MKRCRAPSRVRRTGRQIPIGELFVGHGRGRSRCRLGRFGRMPAEHSDDIRMRCASGGVRAISRLEGQGEPPVISRTTCSRPQPIIVSLIVRLYHFHEGELDYEVRRCPRSKHELRRTLGNSADDVALESIRTTRGIPPARRRQPRLERTAPPDVDEFSAGMSPP